MEHFLFSSIITIFVTLNPIGNIPIFIAILKRFPPKKQRQIIFRETTVALAILLLFGFLGQEVLHLLGVELFTVRIAGGIILFLIALTLLFPQISTETNKEEEPSEPFIVPLATPVLAGAGTISLTMVTATQLSSGWLLLLVILAAWIPAFIILMLSSSLRRFLGEKGLIGLERFSGMLLVFISLQMIVSGFSEFWTLL